MFDPQGRDDHRQRPGHPENEIHANVRPGMDSVLEVPANLEAPVANCESDQLGEGPGQGSNGDGQVDERQELRVHEAVREERAGYGKHHESRDERNEIQSKPRIRP